MYLPSSSLTKRPSVLSRSSITCLSSITVESSTAISPETLNQSVCRLSAKRRLSKDISLVTL
ncbi:hypothetical protein MBAV_006292 [Candidatus Magnetobacterium bavaricum]|uniref:Uncharacterized protein n=1 Tax=Candidatus Magnetobacterium bavaricum TaxID=29290 RepID=A0A0F3GLF9_9BACT|nr:hypothetical protein MBAV_006292 [Candidatus Magnetobacterium bavaricum]